MKTFYFFVVIVCFLVMVSIVEIVCFRVRFVKMTTDVPVVVVVTMDVSMFAL